MPYKDPEKLKEFKRDQMRRRREAAKSGNDLPGVLKPSPELEPPPTPEPAAVLLPDTEDVSPVNQNSIPNSDSDSDLDFETEFTIIDDPVEVAKRTRKLLDTRGWVVWHCSIFDGNSVAIIRDQHVTGYPEDIPVYTETELYQICERPPDEIRTINRIKEINPKSRLLKSIKKED
jgi:hypothetical protein